jgi:hypothetical protein
MDQAMTDRDNTNQWAKRAEMLLASAATAGQLITYAGLAEAARIPGPQRIHKLTSWLEQLVRLDSQTGQPIRSALVISRSRDGLPAPGFFAHCQKLGLYDGPESGPQAQHFHQSCLAAFSAFQSKR